jgi:hypothetical protein
MPFEMLIGQGVLMIDVLQVASLYIWEAIFYHGVLRSRQQSQGIARRLSINF